MSPPDETEAAPGAQALSLREMVVADLEEVMVIERAAFKHPWSADLFGRELQHEWSTVLVAERPAGEGRRIVGFIIYWLVHDEIHILNVATNPSERRQGIARALLTRCVAAGHERGMKLATLEVRRSNTAAIQLYETFGFRIAGVRPKYYSDEGEDALVMLLDL